jgi:hypothetical protein
MKTLPSAATRNIHNYQKLHECNETYGSSSINLFTQICIICADVSPSSLLDIGCGHSVLVDRLSQELQIPGYRYDPAIPEFAKCPVEKTDLVINTDVLEHLDVPEIPVLLHDIKELSERAYFNISTRAAGTILPNGENAHATIRPRDWWIDAIEGVFGYVYCLPSRRDQLRCITWKPRLVTKAKIALHDFWDRKKRKQKNYETN